MPTYLTTAAVDARIGGTNVRQALFTEDEAGSSYDSTAFDAVVADASAIVQAAAENAGYTVGDTSSNALVVAAAFGQFVALAYARKGQDAPARFSVLMGLAEGIRQGLVPIPGLDPTASEGVGSVVFADSSTTATDGRPPVHKRLRDYY